MDNRILAIDGGRLARWRTDLFLLVLAGAFLAFLGPFASSDASAWCRAFYWITCVIGGGLIGMAAHAFVPPRRIGPWARVIVATLFATPAAALLVMAVEYGLGADLEPADYVRLLSEVWPILLAILAVRALIWREAPAQATAQIVASPPLPDPDAAFRRRLSAKFRHARLIAVEAHDHYLRIHTDAGCELIAMPLKDAVAELAGVKGWRVHRSWWVAADAVLAGRWRRNVGELELVGGVAVPVSRTYASLLRDAGWF